MQDQEQDNIVYKRMKKYMPAISVIIPIYNVEKFLRRCLDSVLNQTFTDWQAVCVNDGSPDNSAAILKEFAARDKRFKIITKENGGLSDARNVGMENATGEYVMFLDSDDFLHPQTFEITHRLATREKAGMVTYVHDLKLYKRLNKQLRAGCDLDQICAQLDMKKYDVKKIPFKKTDDVISFVTEKTHSFGKWKIRHCYPCMALYRRDLIRDHQFIKGIIMEDFPWWSVLLLRRPRTVITKLPLYFYIPQMGSILASAKELRRIEDIATGIKYTYAEYLENGTSRELEIWNHEVLWMFVITCFRGLKHLETEPEIEKAKSIFMELNELGILSNPSYRRARKYRRRILEFIKE